MKHRKIITAILMMLVLTTTYKANLRIASMIKSNIAVYFNNSSNIPLEELQAPSTFNPRLTSHTQSRVNIQVKMN